MRLLCVTARQTKSFVIASYHSNLFPFLPMSPRSLHFHSLHLSRAKRWHPVQTLIYFVWLSHFSELSRHWHSVSSKPASNSLHFPGDFAIKWAKAFPKFPPIFCVWQRKSALSAVFDAQFSMPSSPALPHFFLLPLSCAGCLYLLIRIIESWSFVGLFGCCHLLQISFCPHYTCASGKGVSKSSRVSLVVSNFTITQLLGFYIPFIFWFLGTFSLIKKLYKSWKVVPYFNKTSPFSYFFAVFAKYLLKISKFFIL